MIDSYISIKIRFDELLPGQKGRIPEEFSCGILGQRIMEMGLVKGTEISLVRKAPSSDPIEIALKGYSPALRKVEAVKVFLEADQS